MNSSVSRTSAEDVRALNMDSNFESSSILFEYYFCGTKISTFGKKTPRKRAVVLRNFESYRAFPQTDISLSCWLRREERMTTPTFRVYFDFELHAYLKNCESNRNLPLKYLKYLNSRLKYTFCDRGFK